MHANAALLSRLFTALDEHDHEAMASCYHPDARFRDIAFDRKGRDEIHSMWRMICNGNIRAKFEIVHADDGAGRVKLIDAYTFGASKNPPDPGRPVVNAIESRFLFKDGLIRRHDDVCDAKDWALQALGEGIESFLAGRFRLLRSRKAQAKLDAFLEANKGSGPS